MTEAQEAVARGAALLDKHCSGWINKINLDTLDMTDCEACIIGQTIGYFGLSHMTAAGMREPYLMDFLYGFNTSPGMDSYDLEAAWTTLINERRAACAPTATSSAST